MSMLKILLWSAKPMLYCMAWRNKKATENVFDTNILLTFKHIHKVQRSDEKLLKLLQSQDEYSLKIFFCGGGIHYELIVYNKNKKVIPTNLQRRIVEWYQEYLCHPGETRTEQTVRQHYTWKSIRRSVHDICTTCHTCRLTQKGNKKYGRLPKKSAEADPWDVLCIDLIGPYKLDRNNKSKKPLIR